MRARLASALGLAAVAVAACQIDVHLGDPNPLAALMDAGAQLGQCPAAPGAEPELVADEPEGISAFAVDETHVYWIARTPEARVQVIARAPLAGGAKEELARVDSASHLAVAGGSVFFDARVVGAYEVREVPKAGGAVKTAARSDAGQGYGYVRALTSDAARSRVLVVRSMPDELVEVGPGGAGERVVAMDPSVNLAGPLAVAESEVFALVDHTYAVAHVDDAGADYARSAFGVVAITREGAARTRSILGVVEGQTNGLALDGERLWVTGTTQLVGVSTKPGPGAAPVLVDAGGLYPRSPRAAGGFVYWVRSQDSAVVRVRGDAPGEPEIVQERIPETYLSQFELTRCSLVFDAVRSIGHGVASTALYRRPRR